MTELISSNAKLPTLNATTAPTVGLVGLGYVGLPTAIALAHAGLPVIGFDVSERRLADIVAGEVNLLAHERERLACHLDDQKLTLSADPACLAGADTIIVCVPTPVDENLQPDLSILRSACELVVRGARQGQTFVLTSTTYVGTTEELLVQPLKAAGFYPGEDVFICFSPERINPGVAEHTQATTPRVLGGYTPRCAEKAATVLEYTCLNLYRVSSLEAAELTKLYENTFRAVNIALSFEMADAARHYGVDIVEVTKAAATKPYAFMAHYPSAGVGGHCIGVDPYYLLRPLRVEGTPAPMTEKALELVSGRPHRVTRRALELLERPVGARALVAGASYKPGVADIRESPALEIISGLAQAGVQVEYFDPLVPELGLDGQRYRHVDAPQAQAYDLIVVVTVHPGVDYAWLQDAERVLDCTYRTAGGHLRYTI